MSQKQKEERFEKVVEYDKEWKDTIVLFCWIFVFELGLFSVAQAGYEEASKMGIFFNFAFIILLAVVFFFGIRKVYWRRVLK